MTSAAGRKSKPAALKLVEGRGNGRDSGGRLVKTPPTFRRIAPTPPVWLTDVAREEWDRVLPELTRLDLTKELDAGALAAYCQTWALFVAAVENVELNGLLIHNTGKDGAEWTTANPAVGVQLKASAQLRSWCAEFGLTPSAEMRLAKPEADDGDKEANPFA